MKFEIEDFAAVKLNSANFRSQLHGEEHVPAVDLGFTMDAPNTILSYFDGWLLTALYYCSAASNGQKVIDGVDQVLPNLRFPKLGLPIKWEDTGKGFYLEVDYGLGPDESNIELDLCTVGEFRLTPKEGGTVEVKFRVQVSGSPLTEKVCGKLASLIQQEVKIKLLPPQAPADDSDTPQLPTSQEDVSRALFGEPGGEGGDQQGNSNPATPLDALKKAHGVTADAE
jgi:hypothetical protein